MAVKPICRSAGRLWRRLPTPKSRVSLIVVSVRSALPSLWFLSPRPEPGYDVTDGHAFTRQLLVLCSVSPTWLVFIAVTVGPPTAGRPARETW